MGDGHPLISNEVFPNFLPQTVVLIEYTLKETVIKCSFRTELISEVKDLSLICGESLVSSKR